MSEKTETVEWQKRKNEILKNKVKDIEKKNHYEINNQLFEIDKLKNEIKQKDKRILELTSKLKDEKKINDLLLEKLRQEGQK